MSMLEIFAVPRAEIAHGISFNNCATSVSSSPDNVISIKDTFDNMIVFPNSLRVIVSIKKVFNETLRDRVSIVKSLCYF